MAEEYRSNSHRSKEQETASEERRMQKVVSGGVKRRKEAGFTKILRMFLPGDVKDVKSYILKDVLIPSIRRTINDMFCNGVNMLLGEPARQKGETRAARINYAGCFRGDDRRGDAQTKAQSVVDYENLRFDDCGDAELVLSTMRDQLEHFDVVSVGDLFDLAGFSCDYTANKYGWTDLSTAKVEWTRDGYAIRLPRATSL